MINARILGIDPGTGICGFGVLEGRQALDFGVIATPAHTPLPDRLLDIYDSLQEIINESHPEMVAIEKLFFKQNITTGISVAEARGVVMMVKQYLGLAQAPQPDDAADALAVAIVHSLKYRKNLAN